MSEADIARLQADVDRLRNEVSDLELTLSRLDRPPTDEILGMSLLDAYLFDKPFDRDAFARRPAKIAFLSAAFEMCDPEIIVSCLHFVKQTLTDEAFTDLLDSVPRFRATYDMFLPQKRLLLRMTREQPPESRLPALQDSLEGASEIMKGVIRNEIKRITTRDKSVGVLPQDEKWEDLSRMAQSKNYDVSIVARSLPGSFFSKWESGVDPMQAAIMAKYWQMPANIVLGFANKASKKEQEELVQRHILQAPAERK
jgi:hypothetical protein